MKQYAKHIGIALAVGFYAACSPVMFEKDVDCGPGCVRVDGKLELDYTVSVTGGKVDILFVNDNSGSMSFEQKHVADRFANFISSLDNQGLDYRIGITTTDVSDSSNVAGPINRNGALQDGRLIAFSTGEYFLTPSSPNRVGLFANTIKRGETLQCENFLSSAAAVNQSTTQYRANCPSADERGIYAANLTVDANPAGFIRSDAHLAIVFLADEDVRSRLYDQSPFYRLSAKDLPQTLIENVKARFAGKSLSMHAIIINPGQLKSGYSAADVAVQVAQVIDGSNNVIAEKRPQRFFTGGDGSCLTTQGNQVNNVSGSYGYLYYLGVKMTGGVIGDICSNDYSGLLKDIGESIGGKTKGIELACENAEIKELRYVNEGGTPPGQIQGTTFVFDSSIPLGKTVYLKILCPET